MRLSTSRTGDKEWNAGDQRSVRRAFCEGVRVRASCGPRGTLATGRGSPRRLAPRPARTPPRRPSVCKGASFSCARGASDLAVAETVRIYPKWLRFLVLLIGLPFEPFQS